MKRALRSLLLGLLWSSVWPCYLALLALAARLGPWPRGAGVLAATLLNALALGLLARGTLSWLFKPEGWAERYLEMPPSAARQFRGAGRLLTLAGMALLTGYGTFLNLAPLEFGQVVGLYIATLFIVWQVVTWFSFGTLPTLPILAGGALIVAGGLIVSFWKPA